MGIFGNLFGKSAAATAPQPPSEVEMIRHSIESAEGELHEARVRLEESADKAIKESLEFLVSRKAQALKDLEEKLRAAEARTGK